MVLILYLSKEVSTPRKKRNVLFNDKFNTFYFLVISHQAYGKGPLISKRGNLLSLNGLLFAVSNIYCFMCTFPQTG